MDYLESLKKIKESLAEIASHVIKLCEKIQRNVEQLESMVPPRVNSDKPTVRRFH